MIQSRFTDGPTGMNTCIQVNGPRDQKRRICWVVSQPQGAEEKQLSAVCRRFAKNNGMNFISGRMSPPYENHTWQHEQMYVFEIECTKRTNIFYYEYGKW